MNEIDRLDVTETGRALEAGNLSPHALLARHLEIVGDHESRLNCFITLDEGGAKAAAVASTGRYRDGRPLSLIDGIPIAVKDNIDVTGLPTSNGTARSQTADADSEAAGKLRAAGAVIVGKLNMDECAFGATTNNPHFGATHNPWRQGYTPGGSSGGAAAAVAAGFVLAALGTDTLGSVRIPAAYCGVVGLKATRGLISTRGVVPLGATLDHVGLVCRSVRDSALLLELLAGGSSRDSNAIAPPSGWSPVPQSRADLRGLRIGVLKEAEGGNWAKDVVAGFDDAQKAMEDLGATLVPLPPPISDLGKLRRQALLMIEAEGAHALADTLRDAPKSISDGTRKLFAYGRDIPAEKLNSAQRQLAEADVAFMRLFDSVDLIASPTAPQTAFSFASAVPVNQADLTQFANISGCPAIGLPAGLAPSGLPMSLQLMSRTFDEATLLGAGEVLERRFGRFFPPADDQC